MTDLMDYFTCNQCLACYNIVAVAGSIVGKAPEYCPFCGEELEQLNSEVEVEE
jgi:rubrerythrin